VPAGDQDEEAGQASDPGSARRRSESHALQATGARKSRTTAAALLLLSLLVCSPLLAGPAAPILEPGAAVLVLEGGTRLRSEPSLRADVITDLEEGRWLELVAIGEPQVVAGLQAPWLQVRDPWAPLGDGMLAGPWDGWVWGGLVGPAPASAPQITHALWDRAFAVPERGPGPLMWALRPAADEPGVVELGEWTGPTQAPDRIRPLRGWQAIDAIHRRDPGNGRIWLWLTGRGDAGQGRGQLVPTGVDAEPLEVMLSGEPAEGQLLRGRLFLIDLEGDGQDEAVVQWIRFDRDGEVLDRHFAPFVLEADGSSRPGAGGQVREALLPPPDLRIRAVDLQRSGGGVVAVVAVVNSGARSGPTRLDVTVAPRADGQEVQLRGEVPALVPGEELEIRLPISLPRGGTGTFLVDALVVPVGVEADLGNNRLARWTSPG
jgi:hypothetical protein